MLSIREEPGAFVILQCGRQELSALGADVYHGTSVHAAGDTPDTSISRREHGRVGHREATRDNAHHVTNLHAALRRFRGLEHHGAELIFAGLQRSL